MAEAEKSLGSVQFGPFELALDTQELRKHGIPLKLSGQAIQVLAMLIANPGRLVTREQLQKKLWPADSFGDFEHGLNAAVNKLREKLGDPEVFRDVEKVVMSTKWGRERLKFILKRIEMMREKKAREAKA